MFDEGDQHMCRLKADRSLSLAHLLLLFVGSSFFLGFFLILSSFVWRTLVNFVLVLVPFGVVGVFGSFVFQMLGFIFTFA